MKLMTIGALVCFLAGTAFSQSQIRIVRYDSGLLSAYGLQEGTTCQVEWASSLTDPSRTNWHVFCTMTVTNYLATAEVPTFFRVLGVPDTNLAVGLVGYYPFNGNANDLSGLGNVVTVSGAVLSPDRFGVTNRAYRFDGINDIMTWPESTSSNWFYGRTNLALAFWIKPLQVESSKRIFIEYGTSYFGLEGTTGPGGSVEFCANNDFATTVLTNTIEVAVWNHFVLQVTGTKKELYKNGRLVGQVAYSDPIIPNFVNHTFRMGGRGDAPHWSNSCYDDLRIYNRSLSSNEVWRLYNLPY